MYLLNVAKMKPLLYSKEEPSTKNDLINPNYNERLRLKKRYSSSAICLPFKKGTRNVLISALCCISTYSSIN